ncbi:hypothetical protein BDA96_10G172400 [Sorghum bicolor]|uniref:Uncharacterized protein n=1 Tax=Sorghum bicolor TaxID=4558 RepID=A0A921U0K9_SORBI|nr:hypothetical protein BDA96_10G172400 [Sorghum bicolor]
MASYFSLHAMRPGYDRGPLYLLSLEALFGTIPTVMWLWPAHAFMFVLYAPAYDNWACTTLYVPFCRTLRHNHPIPLRIIQMAYALEPKSFKNFEQDFTDAKHS